MLVIFGDHCGVRAIPVAVEVVVSNGLPGFFHCRHARCRRARIDRARARRYKSLRFYHAGR